MTTQSILQVFLVDDEPLALKRLARLLTETGQVAILGQESDPETALTRLRDASLREQVDALFLDIQMPVLNGFDLLRRLDWQPFVIFTTAYNEYALQAFEVHSIDYLLKPVETTNLHRALTKLQRFAAAPVQPDFRSVVEQLAASMVSPKTIAPSRIASRLGERIRFIELSQITHFYAQDKLTFAATANGNHIIDRTIVELEQELASNQFIRIHRAILLNADYIDEAHSWFGGRLVVRLKDANRTELTVARDRVKELKDKLGF
ncbi:MAG: response regulator transcription factor [Acidobacteria bacterium]|nr:response regulator transcription factor [Acidobacteriota bacterium]